MKNMMVKFGAAALSAAMVFSNGAFLTAGAEEETTTLAAEVTTIATEAVTTEAATEAATTAAETTTAAAETTTAAAATTKVAVSLSALAGKWDYQRANNYDPTFSQGATSIGTVEIKADGTFTWKDTTQTLNGTVKIEPDGMIGSDCMLINFYVNNALEQSGVYRSNNEITIGNGGLLRLFRGAAPAITSTAAPTSGTATAPAATTTAATTTKAANKNDSPKTGDSFPALAISAALLSAAALSITTKKRNK